jgi:hypothetical protein
MWVSEGARDGSLLSFRIQSIQKSIFVSTSFVDPDPNLDPSDPYVFGPPRSGSISQRYGYGSGSFYHQTKIVRKPLLPTVLSLLYDFLSLKNEVNVPSKSNMQKNFLFKFSF